jgi:predicted ArsR family transcriptional regulator
MKSELVLTLDQVRCLGSRRRSEVLGAFRRIGRASVRQVAEHIGISIETVHFHVRSMVETGLLAAVDRVASGKRPLLLYELTAERFVFPDRSTDPDMRKALQKAVGAMLLSVSREYAEAEGRWFVSRLFLQLNPAQTERLIQILERFESEVLAAPGGQGDRRASLTIVLA